jgi:predicted TPR repeat methyltransferase
VEILKPLTLKHQDKEEFVSLALKALIEQIGDESIQGVLDLGPAVGTNVDFFSNRSRNFYVADLFRELEKKRLDASDSDKDWESVFVELLPYEEETRFEVILAWDVLNYLQKYQIEGLAKAIQPFCKSGATLYAQIATRKSMPAQPRRYHILGSDRLLYQTPGQALRSAPLYCEPDLRRMLPGFEVKNTYLLRNGTQEYLFYYSP